MPGMAPPFSCTGIIVVSNAILLTAAPPEVRPQLRVGLEQQARLVTGDDQLTWVSRLGWFSLVSCASGELIERAEAKPRTVAALDRSASSEYWTLDQTLDLVARRRLPRQTRRRVLPRAVVDRLLGSGPGRRSISWDRPRSC